MIEISKMYNSMYLYNVSKNLDMNLLKAQKHRIWKYHILSNFGVFMLTNMQWIAESFNPVQIYYMQI